MIDEYVAYELVGSLIPANGWRAVYAYKSENGCGVFAHAEPLVAFALTRLILKPENDEMVCIVGYGNGDRMITAVEQTENFIAYLGPDETIDDWLEEEARKFVEKKSP